MQPSRWALDCKGEGDFKGGGPCTYVQMIAVFVVVLSSSCGGLGERVVGGLDWQHLPPAPNLFTLKGGPALLLHGRQQQQ